jgi:hypothetical protein
MRFILALLFIVQTAPSYSDFENSYVIDNLLTKFVSFNDDYYDQLTINDNDSLENKLSRVELTENNKFRFNNTTQGIKLILSKSRTVYCFLENLLVRHLHSLTMMEDTIMSNFAAMVNNKQDDFILNIIAPVDSICITAMQSYLNYQTMHLSIYKDELAKIECDAHQVLVTIIKATYDLIDDKSTIPEVVLNLLRCTPSIWPILSGESCEIGNRDQCGVYKILNCYIRQFNCHSMLDAMKLILKNESCPLWEDERLKTDSELYKAHLGYWKQIVISPKKKPRLIKVSPLVKQKKWPYKMPVLFDINSFQIEVEDLCESYQTETPSDSANQWITDEAMHHRKKVSSNKFVKKKKNRRKKKGNTNSQTSNRLISSTENPETTIKDNKQKQKITSKRNKISPRKKLTPSEKRMIKKADFDLKAQDLLQRSRNNAINCSPQGASGNRKFHSFKESTYERRENITNTWQKVINKIFDHERFSTVKYSKFRALWEYLGGKIGGENNGGSHRTLLGPEGEIVAGIFTHSDGQTYGKSVQKYFTDALKYVGCFAN